jgi:hypothetical protein
MPRKPIAFESIDDLPERVVSLATMEHNHTGSWRYIKPIYENRVPPCSNTCPAGTDIEGFLGLIEEQRYADAWVKLKEENPLTRVCGRVCFHPCETACNRRRYDQPVSINALERFAGEYADRSRLPGIDAKPSGKTVAVIGSACCATAFRCIGCRARFSTKKSRTSRAWASSCAAGFLSGTPTA